MRKLLAIAYTLISPSYKRKIISLILLLTSGSLLDFFSLASFLPVLLLIINPIQEVQYTWLSLVHTITGLNDPPYIAATLTVIALIFILIKTQIQVWITYRKAEFAYRIAADLASNTLTRYMNISYWQFTQVDFAHEVNRISNLPLIFANNILIPIGTIISETIVSVLLISCLLWYDYKIFFFLIVLLLPVVLIYRSKRKKINQVSQQLKTTIPLIFKYALQAVENLIEIRIHRKERYFKKRFDQTFNQLGKTFATDHTNNASALRITELIAALCIGVLLLYALLSRQSYTSMMLLLTLYAGASFRIIPSVNRIFAALLQIRSNEYVLQELQNIVTRDSTDFKERDETLPFNKMIELKDIRFAYSGKPIILNIDSLTISKDEKILLTGKSGMGKTSLLLILIRFAQEQRGEIYIDGEKLRIEDTRKWQNLFGYVPQSPSILDASIAENIAFGIPLDQIDFTRMNQLIANLDLQTWVTSLSTGLNTIIGERGVLISGGQRQRLVLARALYHGAQILLLDEITNQLDKQTRQEIMETLTKSVLHNKTIIMVSHHLEETSFFDSIYELVDGRLVKVLQNQKAYS